MTWEPGGPLYPTPYTRIVAGGDPEFSQPLMQLKYDSFCGEGLCGICLGVAQGDAGVVWPRLFEAVSA